MCVYNHVQNQGKMTKQTRENVKKKHFGLVLGPLGSLGQLGSL